MHGEAKADSRGETQIRFGGSCSQTRLQFSTRNLKDVYRANLQRWVASQVAISVENALHTSRRKRGEFRHVQHFDSSKVYAF